MATENIQILRASRNDISDIQYLFHKMFEIFHVDQDVEYPYTENGISYLKHCIDQQIALIAKAADKTIGFLTGGIEEPLPFKTYKQHGHLHNLFVLEEYRGQGVGKQLINQFILMCSENNVHRIITDSDNKDSLRCFYESQGFRISGINYEMDIVNL